ncbi:MAG: amino acid adenylation domain-containing protein [Bacteroidales bacterium]|nr:amino acid adenylation domain-containing protein [Clostridium sp.]MCM1203858.1 amino acid adenylation domain-containing protein [Bacteroidales bacterium]
MHNNMIKFFEDTVKKYPDRQCVTDKENGITFKELQDVSKKLALHFLWLTEHAKNRPIAVFLPKCKEVYEADIACTYSGNIFMNLDVKTPIARIKNILDVIEPVLLVTNSQYKEKLNEEIKQVPIVDIDEWKEEKSEYKDDLLVQRLNTMIDTDPFCIINTSGSTGTPKGVVLNHRSFFDFLNWSVEKFGFDGSERIGALSPVVFDIYDYELCLMMTLGSSIILLDNGMAVFPARLLDYMKKQEVNFIFWVPSIMVNIANMQLLEKIPLDTLKTVWFAGEVFPTKQFNYWRKSLPDTKFANLYGPIEITLDCTYYIVERKFDDSEPLPIGYACENTDVLILNDENKPCGKNEIGELCVRGTSLAMGYYNNPEKTADAFVQNPLNHSYPELIYRTGDLAQVNDRDEIIFKGRKDSLIKHMGYRIELGEIEHVLIDTLKLVKYGCVVYRYASKEITLFYEKNEGVSEVDIRKELSKVFPRYMVPTAYHCMDELPRNTNGKIDRLLLSKKVNEEC